MLDSDLRCIRLHVCYFRCLTSACEPADSVLLHFSHLRQGLCQSFPSDVTFSAVKQTKRQNL